VVTAGFSLLLGAGLALASRGSQSLRAFGLVLSHYGAIALALTLATLIAVATGSPRFNVPASVLAIGVAAVVLPFIGALLGRRAGPALAGLSIGFALLVASGRLRASGVDEPWLLYAVALTSMLCLVISGMLDDVRPRVVAGWIGLACVIAAITWAVRGSLLERAAFLAAAGVVAVVLASLLGRLLRQERPQ
jgi:hypothetical protein